MTATLSSGTHAQMNDPEFLRRVNSLRATDNFINWFFLAREYAFLALVSGLTITFFWCRESWGLGWWWNVPVALLAILLMGAGQHRLIMLGHDASHYLLFRNRLLNELASDWFCMFPLLSLTHNYRLQHLAHHQYVNHPENDPDLVFMRAVGHCYRVLMPRLAFLARCVGRRLLWVPGLVKYVRVRARYTAVGSSNGPYQGKRPRSRLLIGVGIGYFLSLAVVMTALAMYGNGLLLALVPAAMFVTVSLFYLLVPERLYAQTLLRPDVPPRVYTLLRMAYMTILFTTLAWLSHLTDRPWGLYYVLLWVTPLLTTFAFFMILREEVQHGIGTDRGRFSSTRLFEGNPVIRWAVFPFGMDYHLPHHLFPLVPHYRLRRLHELLMEVEEYRQNATVVQGHLRRRPA